MQSNCHDDRPAVRLVSILANELDLPKIGSKAECSGWVDESAADPPWLSIRIATLSGRIGLACREHRTRAGRLQGTTRPTWPPSSCHA